MLARRYLPKRSHGTWGLIMRGCNLQAGSVRLCRSGFKDNHEMSSAWLSLDCGLLLGRGKFLHYPRFAIYDAKTIVFARRVYASFRGLLFWDYVGGFEKFYRFTFTSIDFIVQIFSTTTDVKS